MKRSFNISIKRSANYQSVEISEGFEEEMTDKQFEAEKITLTKRVSEKVTEVLKTFEKPTKEADDKKKKIFDLDL